jgi:THAP4-like, heme-binding beta-barrel domain
MPPAVHPDVEPLAFLLGTWKGEGAGWWPTTEAFRYGEEMTFEHVGDPFLMYSQRSWLVADGSPLHFERGFFRPAGPGRLEIVLAHPLGIVEVAEGTVSGSVVDVASTTVTFTRTGSPVTELRRRMEATDGVLTYRLDMAMRDVELTRHLLGELTRVRPDG